MAPRKYPVRPGSAGFNGHAKSCDCDACAEARLEETHTMWKADGRYAVPETNQHTVFVNSYFCRQPNHLAKKPNARARLRELVLGIQRLARS